MNIIGYHTTVLIKLEMVFDVISTERLLLRKVTPEVYEYVFTHYKNEELLQFFGYDNAEQLNLERNNYKKGMSTYNKSFVYFQLLKKENNALIGWCSFHTWYMEHKRAEIGYALTYEKYKGQGYMTEAIGAVIRFGFCDMGLNRIEAFISPDNIPSLKLMDKLNFTREGHLKQHYIKNGAIEDSVVFSLLKIEYERNWKRHS